jgi:hypothetical protein
MSEEVRQSPLWLLFYEIFLFIAKRVLTTDQTLENEYAENCSFR